MKELNLEQLDDTTQLMETIKRILVKNSDSVVQYKQGKTNVLQFFIGLVMAETKGRANPKILKEILEKMLSQK